MHAVHQVGFVHAVHWSGQRSHLRTLVLGYSPYNLELAVSSTGHGSTQVNWYWKKGLLHAQKGSDAGGTVPSLHSRH